MINRVDFIRGYQSGHCSLFLLYVILAPASVHAPADVLSACGFASRSAAQELFFSKAKLLHDFSAEDDPLLMLQGSIILCMVILDHPTDRDFGYWFHNAIRLATKLDIRNVYVSYPWTMAPEMGIARINCLRIFSTGVLEKTNLVQSSSCIEGSGGLSTYVLLLLNMFCSYCSYVVFRHFSCLCQY